jgi:hypothetical protein
MGKQAHLKTSKEHAHAINIFEGHMTTNKERLKYHAKLLRRPEDRYVWPKGTRKGSVSANRRKDNRDCQ